MHSEDGIRTFPALLVVLFAAALTAGCTSGVTQESATAEKKSTTQDGTASDTPISRTAPAPAPAPAPTANNKIDFRLNPSYMSGWEVFHLSDAQNAASPFPALQWSGGGAAAPGSYPYQTLGSGLGGYRNVRYNGTQATGLAKSDTGVWVNVNSARYCCVRKRIQLTGNQASPVSVSVSGHADDDLQVFVRNSAGQVSSVFRDSLAGPGNFSGTATFSTLKTGTNWVEAYATDGVFSGTTATRHIYIAMAPIMVPVAP